MLNPNPEKHGIKRYFYFGSEMGNWAPRDMPWLNVAFIRELQLVRKYGLSFLSDAIERVDSRILNPSHFHGYFEKINKSRPDLAIYHDWYNGRKTRLKGIPRTSIGFDTFYSATFSMTPLVSEEAIVPLNPQHKIVREYLKFGSWKKADIHPQEGKRATREVLEYHMKHCLHGIQEDPPTKAVSESIAES